MNKLEIVNNALLSIGEDVIASLADDNEPAARIVNHLYDQSRKVVLSSADWPFVTVQEKLKEHRLTKWDAETDEVVQIEYNKDYQYVFDLPEKYLYIEKIFVGNINEALDENGHSVRSSISHNYLILQPSKDWDIKYVEQVEAPAIVSRFKDNLVVEYIKDIDKSCLYSDLFSEALSLFLAYKLCMPIKKDPGATRAAYQVYETFMQQAEQRMLNEMRHEVPNFVPDMIKARDGRKDYKRHR
jgi:hypothetical protein